MSHGSSDNKRNPLKSIISGGIVGGTEICITYPTEYVKTQMQLNPQDAKKGIGYILKSTVSKFGIGGFYRGMSVLIVLSIPKTASRFGANEYLKNNIFKKKDKINVFMAGLGAGVTEAVAVVTPAETIKTKLIHDKLQPTPQYKGLFSAIGQIAKKQGISGCYKGLVPTVLRQGTNQGIRFLVYDEASKFLKNNLPFLPGVTVKLLGGAIAGAASVFGNTPVDVIKTRMQGLHAKEYKNTFDCAVQIMKKEGPKGFYKGTVPRLSRVVLDVAITFTLYDYISDTINKYWPDKKKQI